MPHGFWGALLENVSRSDVLLRLAICLGAGLLLLIRKKTRRARSGEDEAQALKAASGTDAKVLAGAISSFAREGHRMVITAIGAAAANQAIKAIAIARKNIEEEAIDLTCKPEFTEVNEGVTALRMLLLVEQT